MPARFIDHPAFAAPAWNSLHPLAFSRQAAVRALAEAMGWLAPEEVVEANLPETATLERFHDREYLQAFEQAVAANAVPVEVRTRFGLGTMENPIFPGLWDRARATVGGSIAAARVALEGEVAFHPAGGTHHGKRDRASGFCYLNDPAFAIATLLDGGVERLFYLDLDAHHGDGVEMMFAGDARVQTASLHEEGRWPHSGTPDRPGPPNATNLPLPKGFNDSELDWLVAGPLGDFAARWRPQAIVVCAGADCLHGDPLSSMELSNRALWRAVSTAAGWAGHVVVLGGGGYNPWTVARCWAGLWATLAGRDAGAPPTREASQQLATFSSDLVDDDEVEPEWLDSIADAPRPGTVREELRRRATAAFGAR